MKSSVNRVSPKAVMRKYSSKYSTLIRETIKTPAPVTKIPAAVMEREVMSNLSVIDLFNLMRSCKEHCDSSKRLLTNWIANVNHIFDKIETVMKKYIEKNYDKDLEREQDDEPSGYRKEEMYLQYQLSLQNSITYSTKKKAKTEAYGIYIEYTDLEPKYYLKQAYEEPDAIDADHAKEVIIGLLSGGLLLNNVGLVLKVCDDVSFSEGPLYSKTLALPAEITSLIDKLSDISKNPSKYYTRSPRSRSP